jgi:HK97 family phage prohead protease
MTREILYRTADLATGAGRTVYGVAVPYGVESEVRDDLHGRPYFERFEYGSFARSIRERGSKIKLLDSHNRHKLPVGKAVELREESHGLFVAFQIAATRDGDDALELVRSGVVDAFSIGFRGVRDRQERTDRGDVLVRTEAALMEVSLVSIPAYPGAVVQGVRSQSLIIPKAVAERRLKLLGM